MSGGHTPGPWTVGERPNLTQVIRDSRNRSIAETKHRGLIGAPECKANAYLISAAPETTFELERMIEAAEACGWGKGFLAPARAAIAKAKGGDT